MKLCDNLTGRNHSHLCYLGNFKFEMKSWVSRATRREKEREEEGGVAGAQSHRPNTGRAFGIDNNEDSLTKAWKRQRKEMGSLA